MASATTPLVPLVRAFSRELARAGGLLAPDYLESGLSLGEARCLYELGQADRLGVSELASRLELDVGYVSRVLSRLVAQRLAVKTSADHDRRARTVVLTRAGRTRLAALEKRADERLRGWLRAKPAGDLERLTNGLEAFLGAGKPFAIGDARPGHIGRIIARHGEIYAEEYGYPPIFERYVVEAFAKFVKDLSPPRDRVFVAERGGSMLGSVAMKGLAGAVTQLRFLLVEPAARGQGVGRQLVQAAIDHARRCKQRRIVLDTASDLDAARSLYMSFGFRKVASTPGVAWLRKGVTSERWALDLHRKPGATRPPARAGRT